MILEGEWALDYRGRECCVGTSTRLAVTLASTATQQNLELTIAAQTAWLQPHLPDSGYQLWSESLNRKDARSLQDPVPTRCGSRR